MMDSKNHNTKMHGFAFLEIMISLLLLALFGTNLFMVQAHVFSFIYKIHQQAMQSLHLYDTMATFDVAIAQAQQDKKVYKDIFAKNDTELFSIKKIPKASSLYKQFSEGNLYTITPSKKTDASFSYPLFLFYPEPQREQGAKKELGSSKPEHETESGESHE